MKHPALLALGGAAAGFAGVLLLHQPAHLTTAGQGSAHSPAASTGAPGATGPAVPAGGTRSATGASEQYGYGVLSVKVTVAGTRITGVTVPALQTADPTSQQITTQVIPLLRSQVMSAQSARINGISGATYTSQAYATSLQSALDKLHSG